MIKKITATSLALALVMVASPVFAVPTFTTGQLTTPGTSRTLVLPPAADNSTVISLGEGVDPVTGKVVEGIAIIHFGNNAGHRSENAKPPGTPGGGGGNGNGGGGGGKNKVSSCFAPLSKGAVWKVTNETWVVNTTNSRGLGSSFVVGNLTADIDKWEDATNGTLGDGVSGDILGNGSVTAATLVADTVAPDGQNEVYFADISSSGAIAVTIVWGIFGGPPSGRELVEWDQVYDDVDYNWSETGEAGKMDFENIATHELGHTVGLGHPDDSCAEETMYRFADFGETKKRSLEAGDIAGADKLY